MESIAFWTMMLVAATIALAAIAWYQLHALSKTSEGEFIHKFKDDFFRKETRDLFALVENECVQFRLIHFRGKPTAHFQVVASSIPPSLRRLISRRAFSSYEIDDLLLGHFEDLGLYEQRGIIDIEMVYELFDTYIEVTWENEEIQKYVAFSREPDADDEPKDQNFDVYDKFECIYKKCRSFGEAKKQWTNKRALTRWTFKLLWKLSLWPRER